MVFWAQGFLRKIFSFPGASFFINFHYFFNLILLL